MGYMNRSILAGRLLADPIIRCTREETAVANFQLAVSRDKKTKESINCIAFGNMTKIIGEYLKKGKLVAIEGRLQIRSYQDKNGKHKTVTEIIVDEMQMLDYRIFKKECDDDDKI